MCPVVPIACFLCFCATEPAPHSLHSFNPAYFLRNSPTHLVYSGSSRGSCCLLSDVNRKPADVESMLSRIGLHIHIIEYSIGVHLTALYAR